MSIFSPSQAPQPYQMPYPGIGGYQTNITQGPLWSAQQVGDAQTAMRSPLQGQFAGNPGAREHLDALRSMRGNEDAQRFGLQMNPLNTQMDFMRRQADAQGGRQMQGWLAGQNRQQQQQLNPIMQLLMQSIFG